MQELLSSISFIPHFARKRASRRVVEAQRQQQHLETQVVDQLEQTEDRFELCHGGTNGRFGSLPGMDSALGFDSVHMGGLSAKMGYSQKVA
jgi:hypothetical protein